MNEFDFKIAENNLRYISQSALLHPFSIQITSHSQLRITHFVKEKFLTALYSPQSHERELKRIIEKNLAVIEQSDIRYFIREDGSYTELFLALQQFHQTFATCRRTKRGFLSKWDLPLPKLSYLRDLHPLESTVKKVENLEAIPPDQYPYQKKKGWFTRHALYHYNQEDAHISHGKEAMRIFLSTQKERFLSAFGKLIERICRLFHREITLFRGYHYFRNQEDLSPEKMYRLDSPLAAGDSPTSYWIGHATCLMRIPLTTPNGNSISVNLITDPVEGDLNKLLYPRMTKPARLIEECPAVHVYLLSHNHLDHFDASTIQKLLAQQPLLLVPKGDGSKYRKMGFTNLTEMDWWQTATLTFERADESADLRITAVPAHHWSGQGPCDSHRSSFLGYVIHGDSTDSGDLYFAGDTARLSEAHIQTLKERFNIQMQLQPGGPDEVRKDMESTHQASVDGLWMHVKLLLGRLYETEKTRLTKEQFLEEAKRCNTLFMHTKTFKLGNLHFDDTESSIGRVLDALRSFPSADMKPYEVNVYKELCQLAHQLVFEDTPLTPQELAQLLTQTVHVPKIGERSLLKRSASMLPV